MVVASNAQVYQSLNRTRLVVVEGAKHGRLNHKFDELEKTSRGELSIFEEKDLAGQNKNKQKEKVPTHYIINMLITMRNP